MLFMIKSPLSSLKRLKNIILPRFAGDQLPRNLIKPLRGSGGSHRHHYRYYWH
uniref:Uncharacterized protein n=1 Tax=Coxiella burnetii TaxID=777 RepID=Q45836_COXBE|nr:unknown [Coxiella burnetii]